MTQSQTKTDVFGIITNRIIEQLQKGTIPWHQPWKSAGPPRNLITGHTYRGFNILLLSSLGYSANLFLSMKQVNELGGLVKKGERSCPVIFWSKKEMDDPQTGEKKEKRILRYYSVFNVDQCSGIPEERIPELQGEQNDPIKACEKVIEDMPHAPKIVHKAQEAFYVPKTDIINMPKLKSFIDSESYYGVLFHELIHSTGHESRLNREGIAGKTEFKSELYSEEELIAQIGSCFLTSHTGSSMKHFPNDVAYIDGWLKQLKNDRRLLIFASAKAQRAVDYILGYKFEEIQDQLEEAEASVV